MSSSKYHVQEVKSKRNLRDFIKYPYRLYKNCEFWVPPLLQEQKKLFNLNSHPVYEHIKIKMFLCYRENSLAGRIAYISNELHNKHWSEGCAFFGFFDSENDPEISKRLLEVVEQEARKDGALKLRGPFNPTINYSCGLLVDGFEVHNAIMMPYNFDYYENLIQSQDYSQAMDLFAFEIFTVKVNHELLNSLPDRERQSITYRILRVDDLDNEILKIARIFNDAWSDNWGFIPITDEEARALSVDLKHVIRKEYIIFAQIDGKEVGFIMAIPDLNVVLRNINGKLFPFGWLKLLSGLKGIKKIRVMTLGVTKDHKNTLIPYELIKRLIKNGIECGIESAELSWILEGNLKMIKPLIRLGANKTQTYRIYEKIL